MVAKPTLGIRLFRFMGSDTILYMEYKPIDDHEPIPIPRSKVFVLLDGTFVVRWSENRVQELESGQYRSFEKRDFGAPITDYELNQLRQAGIVESFDREDVVLCPTPERDDYSHKSLWERSRTRSYYLNTTLPGSFLQDITDLLDNLGLSMSFLARVRDDFVVLWAHKGLSFQKFDDVEKARQMLISRAPEAFSNTVVAFIETTRRD